MKKALNLLLFITFAINAYAEGSRNLTPANTGTATGPNQFVGYLQHDDGTGSLQFLKPGASTNYKLYIHLEAGERVCYGVRRRTTDIIGNQRDLILTLRTNAGALVQQTTLPRNVASPNQSTLLPGAGVITTYAEAMIGPDIGTAPYAGGYTPLCYVNTTGIAQDFYIEFNQFNEATLSNALKKSWYDLWDFSVFDAANVEKKGRLYSRGWSFTSGADNALIATDFDLFALVPSPNLGNFYVKRIDLTGIRPFGFLVYANATGTSAAGNFQQKRKSQLSNLSIPSYRLFLDNPDLDLYPTTNTPTVTISRSQTYCLNGQPGASIAYTFNTNQTGIGTLLIELNGIPGYQAGTADVLVSNEILTTGPYAMRWDGRDGFGTALASGTPVTIVARFTSGICHFPLWDIEGSDNGGIKITDVRPAASFNLFFWDDTNLPAAQFPIRTMITGTNSVAHSWAFNSGDNRLLNTWSFGYYFDQESTFNYTYSCDTDGDGIANNTDKDDDNDGIPDEDEHGGTDYSFDSDADNIPDYLDPDFPGYVDANGNGVNDNFDKDLDGILNALDLDSDNDGIPDAVEANNGVLPANMLITGQYPAAYVIANDTDGDGLANPVDTDNGGTPLARPDRDTDGLTDLYDLDSDRDGLLDVVEAGGTAGAKGTISGFVDTDKNGLHDPLQTTPLSVPNTDSDALRNYLDIDSDGDGIVDLIEGQLSGIPILPAGTDVNNNGIDDAFDPAVGGTILSPPDTDGDLTLDYRDLDSDNDGVPDLTEGHDGNFNGRPDWDINLNFILDEPGSAIDTDGDGLVDLFDILFAPNVNNALGSNAPMQNTDADSQPDWRDIDDDNDGLITNGEDFDFNGQWEDDFTQGGAPRPDYLHRPDRDQDGITNFTDIDCDNDGILDIDEDGGTGFDPSQDADGDGVPNFHDMSDATPGFPVWVDANGDGTNDVYDHDNDGLPDYFDLDSDNDGIPDAIEANGGIVPAGYTLATAMYDLNDPDLDGLMNVVDNLPGAFGGTSTVPNPDSDGDGNKDFLDLDADADGILDNYEAQTTAGYFSYTWVDIDGDALLDAYDGDAGGTALVPVDTDSDGIPDYLDLDSDNDGVSDINEGDDANYDGFGDWDANFNFILDEPGGATDSDFDGIADIFDGVVGTGFLEILVPLVSLPDRDGDGERNWRDTDDDNDGILTGTGVPGSGEDFNGNGNWADDFTQGGGLVPDYLFKSDWDGDGVPDFVDLDSDNDGILDSDEDGGTGFDPSGDADGDGIPNFRDADDLTPGFPPFVDVNGDGINDIYDTDLDGIPDFRDLDSDNDGIPDAVEANGGILPPNMNANGQYPPAYMAGNDANGNGLADDNDPAFGNSPLPVRDTDGDGIPDANDLDSDNDGVPDIIEAGGVDVDGNGKVDNPLDTDMDGLADVVDPDNGGTPLPLPDTDLDGIPDYRDLDSDNDGIPDAIEYGGTDNNGDGLLDGFVDTNGDGFNDNVDASLGGTPLPLPDRDLDGRVDALDLDSDNDGIPDIVEAGGTDADGDGKADGFVDTNGNGFNDHIESYPLTIPDADGDGLADYLDLDSDNDGIPDAVEANLGILPANMEPDGQYSPAYAALNDVNSNGWVDEVEPAMGGTLLPDNDTDGDGYKDRFDLDSDNDGIPDAVEANGGILPANMTPNGKYTSAYFSANDTDGDGIADQNDPDNGGTAYTPLDTDGDGIPDYLDLDSDGDGIVDVIEAGGTADATGKISGWVDFNRNGIDDALESTPLPLLDTDGDGLPDYRDIDSDDDGITDNQEAQLSTAYLAPSGTDANNDGLDDAYQSPGGSILFPIDSDSDGTPDYRDTDSDNDGVPDIIEGHDGNFNGFGDWDTNSNFLFDEPGATTDSDGDGLKDIFDTVVGPGAGNATGSNATIQNRDGDAFPDWRDTDDDNDGIPTGNGTPGSGEDFNGNGNWADDFTQSGSPVPDYLYRSDWDNDGVADLLDIDSDNDGIPDVLEDGGTGFDPSADADGDGIPNYRDDNDATPGFPAFVDVNGDGTNDIYDTDLDGTPDFRDLDSDNDGIPDAVEANGGVYPVGYDPIAGNFPLLDPDGDGLMSPVDNTPAVAGGTTTLPVPDSDGDGLPDFMDIDSDSDGIPDNIEAQTLATYIPPSGIDANSNGWDDAYDGSAGGSSSPPVDTDGDLAPDYLDFDSDNDGVPDWVEGADSDFNGIADWDLNGNFLPDEPGGVTDSDGDGLADLFDNFVGPGFGNATGSNFALQNTDGDALPDWQDADDDNDGIPTAVEDFNANSNWSDDFTQGGTPRPDYLFIADHDGDGIPDAVDLDSDNDGMLDTDEDGGTGFDPSGDADGDGIPNYLDRNDLTPGFPPFVDLNGDGVNDVYDSDLDGIPDFLDLDSDNDGIPDAVESNGGVIPPNMNANGQYPPAYAIANDANGNGLVDDVDPAFGGIPLSPIDTDGDGIPNYLDLDSDNDGIVDLIEAGGVDLNGDGKVDNPTDTDGDGLADTFDTDNGGTPLVPVDTDGDGHYDFLDLDSDNDGITDATESGLGLDLDGNGYVDGFLDLNGNGLHDALEPALGGTAVPLLDSDGDGIPNIRDLDSDNDGIPDAVEANGGVLPPNMTADGQYPIAYAIANDSDGDGLVDDLDPSVFGNRLPVPNTDGTGLPDFLDLDSDDDGIPDAIEANGGVLPANMNSQGQYSPAYVAANDADGDGLADDVDPTTGGTPLPITDTDLDGYPDYIDIDSDGDGIRDAIEGPTTGSYAPLSGVDSDGDGIDDVYDPDNGGTSIVLSDFDSDGTPDYLDLDSDGDGVPDLIEGNDNNADGIADSSPSGNDANGNGLDDTFDGATGGTYVPLQNTDGADDRDWRDTDDDNDGIPTGDGTAGSGEDFNGNGDWSDDFTQGGTGVPDYLYNTPMPIQLVYFEGQRQHDDALLTWKTESENQSDYFLVFRSTDGIQYEKVGQVTASGTTSESTEYRLIDADIVQWNAPVLWYRLTEVDLNGATETFKPVSILVESSNLISVYPNPVKSTLNLEFFNASEGNIVCKLFNAEGKCVMIQTIEGGNSFIKHSLDLNGLSSGAYLLTIVESGKRSSFKILKQD